MVVRSHEKCSEIIGRLTKKINGITAKAHALRECLKLFTGSFNVYSKQRNQNSQH